MGYNRVKKIMKKRILLLSVLMTLGVATFLSSCKKEDSDSDSKEITCTCTETDEYGNSATETFKPADYGVGSCAALEDYFIMNMGSQGFYYSCR